MGKNVFNCRIQKLVSSFMLIEKLQACKDLENKELNTLEILRNISVNFHIYWKNISYKICLWNSNFSTLQIFTPRKLRGLGIVGSLQGNPALSMEKDCKNQKEPYICCRYIQIAGKPHDNFRISPQSVNITVFAQNRENLQRPRNIP